MKNNLYERYEQIRDLRGYTDYKVTQLAGIKGTATISNWKNGKYIPKEDKMKAIADALEVSLDYLKGDSPYTECKICGFLDDFLSPVSRKQHEEYHNKFLNVKNQYSFFMDYSEASKSKTESILTFRNDSNPIEKRLEAFDTYLKCAFSIEVINCNYETDRLDYEEFCKVEVATIYPDWNISEDFIDILIEKYGVDRNFLNGNEQLLARVSNNEQLIRILSYAERLTPEMLNSLEIQMKALVESIKNRG